MILILFENVLKRILIFDQYTKVNNWTLAAVKYRFLFVAKLFEIFAFSKYPLKTSYVLLDLFIKRLMPMGNILYCAGGEYFVFCCWVSLFL